ncbi:hypothetical protein ACFQPA_13655 [Halomarina halobia]|uniref:Uncharacterized protein n=1 Tax=Halomarina halobia TaxID=3033386 RepID=A0ABD6AA38_9EURY|nr:hypothetical protein [Halomarina sp. PSR21]
MGEKGNSDGDDSSDGTPKRPNIRGQPVFKGNFTDEKRKKAKKSK